MVLCGCILVLLECTKLRSIRYTVCDSQAGRAEADLQLSHTVVGVVSLTVSSTAIKSLEEHVACGSYLSIYIKRS